MNSGLSRRQFLATGSIGMAAATLPAWARPTSRPRIALIATEVRLHSHAQHFIDRFLTGYGWAGGWRMPEVDLVSLYVDQFPEKDLARATAARHQVPIYSTIGEALTLGGSRLAVDGVVIIGEHGNYPRNDLGQTLYPRYRFFKQVIQVFEASGRSVPVFNDKHLSTEWSQCVEMVQDSRRLRFPFLAGSSLPVTRRMPALDIPHGTPMIASVAVGYGGMDSYDFHGLETAQCMSERRRGGEVGIRKVLALKGAAMWDHAARNPATCRLLESALSRSHNLPVKDGFVTAPVTFDWARSVFPEGWAYFIEHLDGFKTTLFMLDVRDFNYAGLNARTGEILSCQMYLPMPTHGSSTADFFNPLIHHIERMILDHRVPYPVERTLLTSGMTMAGVQSLHRGTEVATPENDRPLFSAARIDLLARLTVPCSARHHGPSSPCRISCGPNFMWNERYSQEGFAYGTEPNLFLKENAHRLVSPVLSLAEGEGRNAVYLASLGLEVLGVDASEVGLNKARTLAAQRGIKLQTQVVDLANYTPPAGTFASVVSIFCHLPKSVRRPLHARLAENLKPGGVILLEAYTPEQTRRSTGGPREADICPTAEELQHEFPGFDIELLRETERDVIEGRFHTGLASVVQLIARKPN